MERSVNFPVDRADVDDVFAVLIDVTAPSDDRATDVTGGLSGSARVKTLQGERRAQDLRPGDLVLTRDNGYQPLRWSGRLAPAHSTPIRIRKGALGHGTPERVLLVSPEQRFLISGFALRGETEFTVTATQLTCLKGIGPYSGALPTLTQLLFDRHELLLAEGTWTDSVLLTQTMLGRLPTTTQHALSNAKFDAETTRPARPNTTADRLHGLLKGRDPDTAFVAQVTRDRT